MGLIFLYLTSFFRILDSNFSISLSLWSLLFMHRSRYTLDIYGIKNTSAEYWNFSTASLIEEAIRRHEGVLAHRGPFVVRTGHHTGRSPNDKFIVKEQSSEGHIWWGKVNRPIDSSAFDRLFERLSSYIEGRELFVQDCFAGADPRYRFPIRIITETAWHSLFARTMFIKAIPKELVVHKPEFTVIDTPRFHAIPEIDGTNSEVYVIINFAKKLVLIGGTSYAGEIKKSIFTIMNYLLPLTNVFPMHCSANVGGAGDVAVFFGLSGTGKTTLSADPRRKLIGDDEHGWSDNGVFNFEGGCYAKVIKLSKEAEPQIYDTTRRFGTVLENVMIDSKMRRLNLDDASLTENTRAAYPLAFIDNAEESKMGGHPKNIIMLTADAFGVLPPISRLSPEQAMYHFLSGYTAKVAGTEKGLGKEPQATFSTCFGAPFMVHHPMVYANMLKEKISRHKTTCWLVNTGWSGGPFGVGNRMKIGYTRAMITAALNGTLASIPTTEDSFFGLHIPNSIPDVPDEVLTPRNTWTDKNAYDDKAKDLAGRFHKNFEQFADQASVEVKAASPKAGR
ncbi:MAG TPA: phosphoenolpyruvate carboxykinase [Saprospiraceae bacterium]|nr:phosphoenolpyruvate carboxykinase [Saprospiraceae bacterium]